MSRNPGRPFIRGIIGILVILAAIVGGIQFVYAGKIMPNVKVGSASLGGQRQADAADLIAHQAEGLKRLTFTYRGQSYPVEAADIGLSVDAKQTAADAAAVGRRSLLDRVVAPLRTFFGSEEIVPAYSLNDAILARKITDQTTSIGWPVKQAAITWNGGGFSIEPEQNGFGVDARSTVLAARGAIEDLTATVPLTVRNKAADVRAQDLTPARAYADMIASHPLAVTAAGTSDTVPAATIGQWIAFSPGDGNAEGQWLGDADILKPLNQYFGVGTDGAGFVPLDRHVLIADVNRETVGKYVATISDAADHPPVNARLSFADGKLNIVGQAKDGQVVDRPGAVNAIRTALRSDAPSVVLPVVGKPADIRAETLPTLGIKTLIGSATTTFSGSPTNRIYNIGVGASKFDGVLIKPGEEFSFDATLGDVGPETGYRQELVILENKTVPQYGGGLCQVSTTMFRAALDAGLPITERVNHAYAVHYYDPIGMDATIYPPSPDMKFINNTPGYILVQTHQEGVSLTYDFYGTSDGRKSRTEILYANATEAAGGTAAFRYVVEGGPDPIDRVFTSSYQPHSKFPVSGISSLN